MQKNRLKFCRRSGFHFERKQRRQVGMAAVTAVLILLLAAMPALAAKSHFSKVRYLDDFGEYQLKTPAAASSSTTVFDVVISLHNDPSGDDDPDKDTGSEDQTKYEKVIRFWADGIYEQSNGAHKLGKVRIFRNGQQSSKADVVWNASEWPRANVSGFGVDGRRITFGDVFPGGCGTGCNLNMLSDPKGAGYTLAHEWGHYVYGLYDEYKGSSATSAYITSPLSGDTPVTPSIMHSQWKARNGDYKWLNHSTSNNYQANTAQGRAYGASCWDVLVRDYSKDPRDGKRKALPKRTHYTALDAVAPKAKDNWMKLELPGGQNTGRDKLNIIWMEDDLELQIVIDRSGSMSGNAITNAKLAAKTLVDVLKEGKTALGVVSFATNVTQDQAVTPIPDPGAAVKTTIKGVIDTIVATGVTSMYDGADLALTNLVAYQSAKNTSANQVVFLLADGDDNDSVQTEAGVIARYNGADVPLITFGYGYFSPAGSLKRLADGTGGLFFSSPTSLAEIQNVFLAANTAVSDSASLTSSTVSATSGGSSVSQTYEVDSSLESLTIAVNYAGSPGDVDLALLSPAGLVAGVNFVCTAASSATNCIANVDEATLTGEGFGTWEVEVSSTTGSDIEVNINVIGDPAPGRTFDVTVASLHGSTVVYPDPMVLTATVSQGIPITGINLTANITDPNGDTTPVAMNDEGIDGDAVAGDGVYSAIVGYSSGNGIYTVAVKVDNNDGKAQYTIESFQPSHPSPDENGEMPEAPAMPAITENFTRTANIQVTVEGLSSLADHPDFPPGDPMAADNTDVKGAIDGAGDIDYFQITNIDTTNNLVVRVTELALGMDPVLTVYKADGITEVASGSLANAQSKNGYVYVLIPVAKLDATGSMVARVEHADDTAVQGTYAISAGAAVASDKDDISVADFVTRFYQLCLDRNPDAAGLEGWTKNLLNQIQTGADVAQGFIYSPEFIAKNTSNSEYLLILYKAFFDRDPDQGGWDVWLAALNSGRDRGEVLNGFIYSQEFSELSARFGIKAYDSIPQPPQQGFEGSWVGQAVSTTPVDDFGGPCGSADVSLTIANSQISGTAIDQWFDYQVSGSVNSDGTIDLGLAMSGSNVANYSGTLSGTTGSGSWSDAWGCSGTWNLTKQ